MGARGLNGGKADGQTLQRVTKNSEQVKTEGKKLEMEAGHWTRNRQGLSRRRSQQKTSGRGAIPALHGKLRIQGGKKQFPCYYYSISHKF